MAELNPLGSEKLQGNDKIKRILELTYYNSNNEASNLTTNSNFITETKNGVYGIIKETDGYYVKKGLTENSLDYIGGLFMKNKNRFHSYAEAYKKLELLIGQENIQEDTKYVLNQNKPKPESEGIPPAPTLDSVPPDPNAGTPPPSPDGAGVPPNDELGDIPQDDEDGENSDEMGGDTGYDENNPLKLQQKLAGKLGKSLRDVQDRLKPEDVKYFINSVLSALPLDKLEDTDKEEIVSQFEDTDENQYGDENTGNEEIPSDETGGEYDQSGVSPEGDMGEGMDALENLVNTDFNQDDVEEDYMYDNGVNDKNKHDYFEETPLDDEDDDNMDYDPSNVECEHCGYMYGHKKGCPNQSGHNESSFHDDDLEEDFMEDDDLGLGEPKPHSVYNPDTYPSEEDEEYDEFGDNNSNFDINELTEMVNKSVKDNLRKYFK